MKTQEGIKKEIEALKAVRPKVRPTTYFGDDNLAAIDAQINVLENYLDGDEIDTEYGDDNNISNELEAARRARDWMDNINPDEDESLAEDWPLKEGESDDN